MNREELRMKYKCCLAILIVSCFINWVTKETIAQSIDYSEEAPAKQKIILRLGMTDAEIQELDMLYPYLKEVIIPNLWHSFDREQGYEMTLQDDTTFTLILNKDKRLLRIETTTPGFALKTGVGIGSMFAEVKHVYPTYTIMPANWFDLLVKVKNGVSFGFWKEEVSHEQIEQGIIHDTHEVSWIEFEKISIPLTMIRHETGPSFKGLHAIMDRENKLTELLHSIHESTLNCSDADDCQKAELQAIVEDTLAEIEDPQLLTALAVTAWSLYTPQRSQATNLFREEVYQIYRTCIENLAASHEKAHYYALKNVQQFMEAPSWYDSHLKYIQPSTNVYSEEYIFLKELITKMETRLKETEKH